MTLPEIGKAANSTVEALKTNPSCLAAIILAGIFALLVYFSSERASERQAVRMSEVIDIIKRCYPDEERPP